MKRTLLFVLLLTFTLAAFARPREHRGPRDFAFLDLSDAQKTQAAALRSTLRAAIEPLRDQQRANHDRVEAALEAGNSDEAGKVMLANYELRRQMRAAHETFKTSFEALLTPEQKEKWSLFREIRESRENPEGRKSRRPRR